MHLGSTRPTFKQSQVNHFAISTNTKLRAHAAIRRIDGLLKMPIEFRRLDYDFAHDTEKSKSYNALDSSKHLGLVRLQDRCAGEAVWRKVFTNEEMQVMRAGLVFEFGEPTQARLRHKDGRLAKVAKEIKPTVAGYRHQRFDVKALASMQAHSCMGG